MRETSWCRMKLVKVLSQCWKLPEEQRAIGTVYIHWPYCAQLCTYCNFNKYVRSEVDHEQMTRCLVRELTSLLKLSGVKTVTSVYFGGGTPSLARPGTVEAVIGSVREHAQFPAGSEVTLEANPTSAQTDKLRAFKMAGVTRLSVGLQSLVDADLGLMNRDHTATEAKHCLTEAHKLFPGQTNVDVIFGRPHQTITNWKKELKQLLGVCGRHVSLYQLTVERGTALARAVQKNELTLPDNDTIAEMYEVSLEMLEQAGLKRYEVSNFSVPGCESQHNLSYWRGRSYLGIGPGAHSRFCQPSQSSQFTHSVNTPEPNAWMAKVIAKGHGLQKIRQLTAFDRLEEVVAISLRTTEGLTTEVWEMFAVPVQLQEVFSPSHSHSLADLYSSGLLTVDERGVRASARGLSLLDSLLPHLMVCLDDRLQGH